MAANDERIFKAVTTIGAALKDLTPEEKLKVLASVQVLIGGDFPQEVKASPGAGATATAQRSGGKPKSVVEFVKTHDPSTNVEAIVVFAAYRQEYEGLETFSKGDIQEYFTRAKMKPPRNFPRDYAKAVKQGWIHDDDAKSYLTQTGEEALISGFAGGVQGQARPKKKGTARES